MIESIKKGRITHKVIRNKLEYELEPFIIIKYKIAAGKEYDDKKWQEIINENNYYYYDRIALNKLKKLMTANEVSLFLQEKGASQAIIKQLLKKYIDYGYVDDLNYTKLFIAQRKHLDGPKVLKNKLKSKGINLKTINEQVNLINEKQILEEKVIKLIETNKNKTKIELSNNIKASLTRKGYSYSLVSEVVDQQIKHYQIDEFKLLEHEFFKLDKRNALKLDDPKFKTKFRNKLLRKGYQLTDIKIIEQKYVK